VDADQHAGWALKLRLRVPLPVEPAPAWMIAHLAIVIDDVGHSCVPLSCDELFILVSDGLWRLVSPQDAVSREAGLLRRMPRGQAGDVAICDGNTAGLIHRPAGCIRPMPPRRSCWPVWTTA